ncbi:hypothetical protein ACHAWO_012387 [Cyclotella atomus]|jgi:hypothetical protein|uniref:Uncharacterized protein n=1 Tax=Cyclotella atomus TaxID=382360 RepID=A0ABD3N167_9STRA
MFSRLAAREKQAKRDAARPKKSLPIAHVGGKSDEPIELDDDSDVEEVMKPKSTGKKETIEINFSDDESRAGFKPTSKKALTSCNDEVVDLT